MNTAKRKSKILRVFKPILRVRRGKEKTSVIAIFEKDSFDLDVMLQALFKSLIDKIGYDKVKEMTLNILEMYKNK